MVEFRKITLKTAAETSVATEIQTLLQEFMTVCTATESLLLIGS